jgi:hypothetical protein
MTRYAYHPSKRRILLVAMLQRVNDVEDETIACLLWLIPILAIAAGLCYATW